MPYRFTGKTKDGHEVQPFPGIPLESSDREFNEALREYEALHGEGSAAAVRATGLYEHVKDEEKAASGPAKED